MPPDKKAETYFSHSSNGYKKRQRDTKTIPKIIII